MNGRAVLTITSEGDSLDVSMEFEPPVVDEGNPACHGAAMVAFNALASVYGFAADAEELPA